MLIDIMKFLTDAMGGKLPEWIAAGAALASMAGLWFIRAQLQLTEGIARLQFEDSLEKEYRELIAGIPIKALLDSDLSEEEYRESFDEFFRYFDLSNKQTALWKEKRIDKRTWDNWRSGIRFNLSLPAFSKAWGEVKSRTADHAEDFFSELRALEESGFSADWPRASN